MKLSSALVTSVVTLGALFGLVSPASAVTVLTYNFTAVDPAAGLGSGPFGSVQVTDAGTGSLAFLVTLASGFNFNQIQAQHVDFGFDLAGSPAVTYTGVLPVNYNWSQVTSATGTPFGTFGYGFECGACSNSNAPPTWAGPLSFTVHDAANNLTLASLGFTTSSYGNVYFVADLRNTAGFTGEVGALGSAVPEPATWAMFLMGFGAVGFAMRGSRRKQLVTA